MKLNKKVIFSFFFVKYGKSNKACLKLKLIAGGNKCGKVHEKYNFTQNQF
jgi:hypothetical protein